jgi:hypothetical protein
LHRFSLSVFSAEKDLKAARPKDSSFALLVYAAFVCYFSKNVNQTKKRQQIHAAAVFFSAFPLLIKVLRRKTGEIALLKQILN